MNHWHSFPTSKLPSRRAEIGLVKHGGKTIVVLWASKPAGAGRMALRRAFLIVAEALAETNAPSDASLLVMHGENCGDWLESHYWQAHKEIRWCQFGMSTRTATIENGVVTMWHDDSRLREALDAGVIAAGSPPLSFAAPGSHEYGRRIDQEAAQDRANTARVEREMKAGYAFGYRRGKPAVVSKAGVKPDMRAFDREMNRRAKLGKKCLRPS